MRLATTLLLSAMTICSSSCAKSDATAQAHNSMLLGHQLENAINAETYKQITSVVISRHGDIVYENYWGTGGRGVLNDTRSAMKTLVAIAVGAAVDDGHIDSVATSAFSWFARERPFRFATTLKDEISVRDLLTMSSALDCDDNDWDTPGNEEHMYPARNWVYFVLDMPTKPGYQRDEQGYGPFAYCTAGSFFLGQIVQRAVGEQVDHYIARRLLAPMGISQTVWDKSPSGEIMTGGGVELTSRDLLKLGELILGNGKHAGKQLVSGSWIQNMTRPHRAANERQNYGYQIWQENFRCGQKTVATWYMGGNGGNKIAVVRELGLVAVVTSTLYGTQGMHQQSTDIIEKFALPSFEPCESGGDHSRAAT